MIVLATTPFSSTTCRRPRRAASTAQARPVGPAPTMMMSNGSIIERVSYGISCKADRDKFHAEIAEGRVRREEIRCSDVFKNETTCGAGIYGASHVVSD